MMQTRCSGIAKSGERCRAAALPGSDFCVTHDPRRVTDLAEWRRRGGKAKSNRARARRHLADGAMTAAELNGVLGVTLKGVLAGKIEPNVGNCVASLARAIRDVSGWAELDERLAALERHDAERPA
jgi:hypothetical protein